MTILAYTVTPDSITMIVDGNTLVVSESSHRNYAEIREAIRNKDLDEAERLANLSKEMMQPFEKIADRVHIEHGVLYLDSYPIHTTLADRILDMREEGFDIDPMCRFLENLYENPSKRSVEQLYDFLEATDLPITEDGHFLAYKMVRENYTDHHTGKFDNSVGAVLEMPRWQVDEDPNRTCSTGFHFCSQGYLGFYGTGSGRTMIVKVNPRDVVSIPSDYNNAKGRACAYTVVGEFEEQPDRSHSFGTTVADDEVSRTGKRTIPVQERKFEDSAGVNVLVSGPKRDGDILYKRDAAAELELEIQDIVDLIEEGEIEAAVNGNNVDLVVWHDRYRNRVNEWIDEFLF